jgi:hypothetical protein
MGMALGMGLGLPFGGLPAYTFVNAEAETVVSAMTTQPDNSRKALIDALVGSLKTAGVWSQLDLLYVLAAHDAQAARLNWKSPAAFAALTVNSPVFQADRGYTGDGASSRLRTQFTPSTNGVNFIQDSASVWVWSRTNAQSNAAIGANGGTNRTDIILRNASDQRFGRVNSNTAAAATSITESSGFFGLTRRDASNILTFRNGSLIDTDAAASTAINNAEQWICGANSTGFSTQQVAVAAWGGAMTDLEASFYSAVNTYMQAAGAA